MSSQSRNEIWAVRAGMCEIIIWWGGRSAKTWSAKSKMSSQRRNLWNHHLRGWICQHLVCPIWALRVGICEITILGGIDLHTLGLPYMSCQSRNQIWALRVGICEIAVLVGQIWAPGRLGVVITEAFSLHVRPTRQPTRCRSLTNVYSNQPLLQWRSPQNVVFLADLHSPYQNMERSNLSKLPFSLLLGGPSKELVFLR